jgi:hypothetical protein
VNGVKSEAMGADHTNVATGPESRPNRAVARTLESADAAAARGDYADALAWLGSLDAIGHQLDPQYESRRARWRSELETGRVGCSQWFG